MREEGIGVNLHYIPIHTQPYFQRMGFKSGDFPESEKYYLESMSLPIFQTMTEAEQDLVVAALKKVFCL
jgi:dTDP-4-amino-4,6-dideoxygalactose transaminase